MNGMNGFNIFNGTKRFASLLLAFLLLALFSLSCLAEPYEEENAAEGKAMLLSDAEPESGEAEDPASAAYDGSICRFNDYVGVVTEEEEIELNERAVSYMKTLRADFPIIIVEMEEDDERGVSEYAEDYYSYNGFGYGESRDGIMLAVDLTSSLMNVLVFGDLYDLIAAQKLQELTNSFLDVCHDKEKRFYDAFDVYLEGACALVESVRNKRISDGGVARGSDPGKPYWYPDDIASFENYTEEKPVRIVDDAEIFTPEEEAILEEKAKRISDTYGFGYAMFTDNSTYGLSMEVYSADFLYFNGFGMGDDFSSVVFFLSLEPGNRGWRTTSTNRCEKIFTSDVTYEIDEIVDADMRGGNYFTAFYNQIDYVEKLLADIYDLPEWYPEGTDILNLDREARVLETSARSPSSRFVDSAGMFSEEYRQKCEEKLASLKETYGADIVIYTDTSRHSLDMTDYASDFYAYNGYGEAGMCLAVVPESGYCDRGFFKTDSFLSEFGYDSLDYTVANVLSARPEEAIDRFLEDTEFLLEHKRIPMSMAKRFFCFIAGLVLGLIAARSALSRMKKGMTLKCELYATEYLAEDSLVISKNTAKFLRSSLSKVARPKDTGSSRSGGGGGGSSYSHGSSSSGGSYSSGGRNF